MELENRKSILRDVFTEQLIHWGLGKHKADIEDVVERLLSNIDPQRSYGAPGRSRLSAAIAEAHQEVFLHYYDMPKDQARALSTALVMWETVTAVQSATGNAETIPLSMVTGLEATRRHRFLFVSDEWLPRSGGISTFNVGLATALATEHHVGCYLPRALEQEKQLATSASVQLFESNPSRFLVDLSAKLLSQLPEDLLKFAPELIVGHDRRTGGIAMELRDRHFKNAKVCVIAHTAPHVIEKHKIDRKGLDEIATGLTERSEYLASLLEAADIAFAVGPRLKRQTKSLVRPECTINLLTPGADIQDKPAPSGKNRFILLFGRAEDAVLKGVELAHDVARVLKRKQLHSYAWNIRGVPRADFPQFVDRYKHFDLPQLYDADPDVLARTIDRAELVLMPSLEEGFGLVALEAIANNRPVLISAQSGVAEFLRSSCPGYSDRFIVSTEDLDNRIPDPHKVVDNWAAAIEHVFENWESAMVDVGRIREALRLREGWKSAKIEFLATCFPIA